MGDDTKAMRSARSVIISGEFIVVFTSLFCLCTNLEPLENKCVLNCFSRETETVHINSHNVLRNMQRDTMQVSKEPKCGIILM